MDEDSKGKSVPSPSRMGTDVTKTKIGQRVCQMLKEGLQQGIDKRNLVGTQICLAGILASFGEDRILVSKGNN